MKEYIQHLDTLKRISELGSFSLAASSLGISGPAVSKRIECLEKYLGKPVLQRSTRKVSLSPFGSELLLKIESLFSELDNVGSWAKTTDPNSSGKIHLVSFDEFVFQATLAPKIPEFTEKYPNILLHFEEVSPPVNQPIPQADIFWGVGDSIGKRVPGLIKKVIASSTLGIFASPKYMAKAPPLNNPNDLSSHKMVSYNNRQPRNQIFFQDSESRSNIRSKTVTPAIETNRGHVRMAKAGLGIVNCMADCDEVVQAVQEGTLIPVLKEYWIGPFPINAYYDISNYSVPHIRTFLNYFTGPLTDHEDSTTYKQNLVMA